MNRPVFRLFRSRPSGRWQKISRNFRLLAIDMGGVLIKLGQFLSVRVDLLPSEVIQELVGLRDELPSAPLEELIPQIEEDFNRPVDALFAWIDPEPLGAASIGQVHLARLAETDEEVVIKVLRPGIDILVETDLAALAIAIRWLKHYTKITARVNLDWLIEEFTTVTRNELDLTAEGKNAETFASDFAHEPQVYIPKIYWDYCADHTLTMENVGYIKIADSSAMEQAGINPKTVAKKLYNVYLHQIFSTHFIHADPHPGNIFIRPLPTEQERLAGHPAFGPGDSAPFAPERSYQIAFVDFGMVTKIPKRLRQALREYAIGVGSGDARRIVQSYVSAGTLLPGADLQRLEEVHQRLIDKFWGADISAMKDMALSEAGTMMREYRDLIYDAPFQLQVDMLFAVRAIAILSGIATQLDEKFDPWQEIIPFAERLATAELAGNWQQYFNELLVLGQALYKLPQRFEAIVRKAERDELSIQTTLSKDSRTILLRLNRSIHRLSWTIMAAAVMISGVLLGGQYDSPAAPLAGTGIAVLLFLVGSWRGKR